MSVHAISRVVGARVWSGLCVEALGLGAPKLTTNFACNSVVRPIGDVEKTAEFQRCGFKV